MKPGETSRFQCNDCDTEFELTLEPKAKGTKEAETIRPRAVEGCPFCGSEDLEQL